MKTATDCDEVQKVLSDYAEGELDEPSRGLVEGHLPGCPPCTGELTLMRALVSGLHRIPEETAPPAVLAAITRRLPVRTAPARPGFRWSLPWRSPQFGFAAAGALALVLLVPMAFRHQPPPQQSAAATVVSPAAATAIATLTISGPDCTLEGRPLPEGTTPIVEGARFETGPAGKGTVAFADGSTVALAAASRATVGADELSLDAGRVECAIEKQKIHFRIRTPQAIVTVWGTRFTVSHKTVTAVEVQEGKVQVDPASGSGSGQLLTAGRRAEIDGGRVVSPESSVTEPTRAEDTHLPLADDR